MFTVGPLVVVAFLVAAGLAAVLFFGAARLVPSEAEDAASESLSTAEYWRFVADLFGGMFIWLILVRKETIKRGDERASIVKVHGRDGVVGS